MSRPGARHGDQPKNKYDMILAKAWREAWRSGKTLKQISESSGVSIGTITRWLTKEARGEL